MWCLLFFTTLNPLSLYLHTRRRTKVEAYESFASVGKWIWGLFFSASLWEWSKIIRIFWGFLWKKLISYSCFEVWKNYSILQGFVKTLWKWSKICIIFWWEGILAFCFVWQYTFVRLRTYVSKSSLVFTSDAISLIFFSTSFWMCIKTIRVELIDQSKRQWEYWA